VSQRDGNRSQQSLFNDISSREKLIKAKLEPDNDGVMMKQEPVWHKLLKRSNSADNYSESSPKVETVYGNATHEETPQTNPDNN